MKMVPEMKDLTYEERLKEMGLPTLYKMVSHMKKIDTQDLLSLTEGDRWTRGHYKKTVMGQCLRNIKKNRMMDIWDSLSKKIVLAENVHILRKYWIKVEMEIVTMRSTQAL